MKRIIALLIACILSGTVNVSAEITTTYKNESEPVKLNITLPDDCIGDYYTLYVLNPGKSIDNLEVLDNTTVLHYTQGIYKEGGVEVEFKINKKRYNNFSEYHFPIVVRSGNFTETITLSAYPESVLDSLIEDVKSENRDEIETLADRLADAFNINEFEEYSLVSDKEDIAEILFKIAKETNVDADNIGLLLKEATLLEGVESKEIILIENDAVKNNDIIGVDADIEKQIASIKNSDACQKKVSGNKYNSIEDLRKALSEAILTSAIYDNKSLGYKHINTIISDNEEYFKENGLKFSSYDAAQKDKVGQALLAAGKKDFDSMIKEINSLASENKSGSNSQGSSGNSSGGSSKSSKSTASSGIVPVVTNKTEEKTETYEFTDLDSVSWAKAKINALMESGIIAKSEDKTFNPNRSITRAEFIKLVVEALEITADGDMNFSDVDASSWFANFVRRGVAAGIIYGDGENFYPDENIKRQDIATILKRALDYKGVSITNTGYAMSFKDYAKISDYAKESVELLYQYGIINGTDTNEFLPQNNATRAEAAVMIYGVMTGVEKGLSPKYASVEQNPVTEKAAAVLDGETEMLVRAGLFPAEYAGNVDKNMTRAEFAKAAAYFTGKKEFSSYSGNGPYADVNEETVNAGYIKNLTDLGYLSAKEEDLYKPDDYISGVDAITMVMKTLGYGRLSDAESDILGMASSIGLLKSVPQSTTPVKVADVITLFHNALDKEVMNLTSSGDRVTMEKGPTFLEAYHDVILLKGVMNGNSITNYYTNKEPQKNTILIDSQEFYISDSLYYLNDYLGYYLEIAYVEETNEVLSFKVLRNEEIVISDEDIESFDGTKLKYYTDNGSKSKSITIPKDAIFVYNGAVVGEYREEIFDIESGSVEIVAANGNDYGMVKIYDYDTFLLNGATEDKIFAFGTNREYDLEKYDNVIIRGENGALKTVNDLKIFDVISAAESLDNKQIVLNVGMAPLTGKISNIDTGEKTCMVNGTEYQYLASSGIESSMSLNNGTFYIDFKGRIAHVSITNNDVWKYGYLIKAVNDDSGMYVFKLLNANGDLELIEQEEAVTVDGEKITGKQIDYCFLYDEAGDIHDEFYPQLIRYRQRSDGVILKIDTIYQSSLENESSLSVNRNAYNSMRIYSRETGRLIECRDAESSGHIENAMLFDENTIIFAVPSVERAKDADEDDYLVYNKAYFDGRSSDRVYGPVWAFDTDFENGALVRALVMPSNQVNTELDVTAMFYVHKMGTTMNENGEEVGFVEGYDFPSSSYKTMISYEKENLFENLKPGDVIRYGTDADGYTCVINHDLDWETAKVGQFVHPVDHKNGSWNSGKPAFACYYGVITHKDGKYISIATEIVKVDGEIQRGTIYYDCSDALVFKLDRETGEITELTPDELGAYVYDANPGAGVYAYSSAAQLKCVMVYD